MYETNILKNNCLKGRQTYVNILFYFYHFDLTCSVFIYLTKKFP